MRDYKKYDPTGPRIRFKYHTPENDKFWRDFKKKYPEYKEYTIRQLRDTIKRVHDHFGREIINNRDGIELPLRLGMIFIGTCQRSKKHISNHKLSQQYLKNIAHRNLHSDSYLAKIFYTNFLDRFTFKFHELWGFKPARWIKTHVGETYPEKWPMYIRVDPYKKITAIFRHDDYIFRNELQPHLQWGWVKKKQQEDNGREGEDIQCDSNEGEQG